MHGSERIVFVRGTPLAEPIAIGGARFVGIGASLVLLLTSLVIGWLSQIDRAIGWRSGDAMLASWVAWLGLSLLVASWLGPLLVASLGRIISRVRRRIGRIPARSTRELPVEGEARVRGVVRVERGCVAIVDDVGMAELSPSARVRVWDEDGSAGSALVDGDEVEVVGWGKRVGRGGFRDGGAFVFDGAEADVSVRVARRRA